MSARNKRGEGRQYPVDVHWYGSEEMFLAINTYAMAKGQTISEAHRAVWNRILRRFARRITGGITFVPRGTEKTATNDATGSSRGSGNGRRESSARTSDTGGRRSGSGTRS